MKCPRVALMVVVVLGCFGGCFGEPATARAQDAVPLKVAVLDLNRVYRDAVAARKVRDLVNSHAASYREETERAEAELRNADRVLAEKRDQAVLSSEAFDEQRQQLELQVQESQKQVQAHRRSLARLQAMGLQQLETVLKQVVEQMRLERGLSLILRSEQTAYVDPGLDITDEVLRRLNQQLPTVSVDINEIGVQGTSEN